MASATLTAVPDTLIAASATYEKAFNDLKEHAIAMENLHLRHLMEDAGRCSAMTATHDEIHLDYSRQRATPQTLQLLLSLASAASLQDKIAAMFRGDIINPTEGRSVLHTALRSTVAPNASTQGPLMVGGVDVRAEVAAVLAKIEAFTTAFREGKWLGHTGKVITDVVAIGIGGSYLGPEFVYEALRVDVDAADAAKGRRLRFLANVDPVDVARATEGLVPESTLVVIVSKTFTTAETMLNAKTLRKWIVDALGTDAVAKHMIAVSTNLKAVEEFGIDPQNAFGFWDWVGGRFSVCSAVGVVPLSLHYGFPIVRKFLAGANDVDTHFATAPFEKNIPVLMGLFGVWNSTFLGYPYRALLPYSQALLKLAPHIQQVDMESNGKRVRFDGSLLPFEAGPLNFGEPGTNGQHSFYQLMHQGRAIPADFVGVIQSQHPVQVEGEPVSNHDELMSNFFAQPDALACGKTAEECRAEGIKEELIPHKIFPGNRPSSSILLARLDAFSVGQLLAIFEHRTAVEGFIWGINSFDQWGVELGKVLAKAVRSQLATSRKGAGQISGFNPSTTALLEKYLQG